jgi:hypothetical protein
MLAAGLINTYAASYAARHGDIDFIRKFIKSGEPFDRDMVRRNAILSKQYHIVSLLMK